MILPSEKSLGFGKASTNANACCLRRERQYLSDAQGRSFTWDFENRLTQVVNPGTGTTTFNHQGHEVTRSKPLNLGICDQTLRFRAS
jgi:hypothetical protein